MLWIHCCSDPATQEMQPNVKPAKGCKTGEVLGVQQKPRM